MRTIYLLCLVGFLSLRAFGQTCTVTKDARERIVTICSIYYAQIMPQTSGLGGPSHRELSYLGSEYFGFPIWQEGIVEIGHRKIPCTLAYNVINDELLVRLQNTNTIQKVYADAFTIGGSRFIADGGKGKATRYYMVLNDGPTFLLKTFKCQLKSTPQSNGYTNSKEEEFDGFYDTQVEYFIKRGTSLPEPVNLTRKSIADVLGDRADKVMQELPRRKLTEEAVIQALRQHDTVVQ